METLTCPRCGAEMETRAISSSLGEGAVSACPEGHGVFLARSDLGALSEAESDWHRHTTQQTTAMPRITQDMTAPPVTKPPARSWVETLFA